MSERLAFRLALVAAVIMFGAIPLMEITAPSCSPLPMPTLTAFELVRTPADLARIFGHDNAACGAPLAMQLAYANVIDTAVYIPAYTAFFALTLYGIGRRDRTIGWIGVGLALTCAVADWFENASLFSLGAAPDAPGGWLPTLIVATSIKWIGLAVVTTLGGVMLWRRGGQNLPRWLGWAALIACAVPLITALLATANPDLGGQFLIAGMASATLPLLGVALIGALPRQVTA
jgi:hypothetical protein